MSSLQVYNILCIDIERKYLHYPAWLAIVISAAFFCPSWVGAIFSRSSTCSNSSSDDFKSSYFTGWHTFLAQKTEWIIKVYFSVPTECSRLIAEFTSLSDNVVNTEGHFFPSQSNHLLVFFRTITQCSQPLPQTRHFSSLDIQHYGASPDSIYFRILDHQTLNSQQGRWWCSSF